MVFNKYRFGLGKITLTEEDLEELHGLGEWMRASNMEVPEYQSSDRTGRRIEDLEEEQSAEI
ncbi:MAG: hypothetical protein P8184_20330 [Calditrichia bacterium]